MMNQLRSAFFLLLVLYCYPFQSFSKGIEFSKEPPLPPRIIRTCCAFGTDVSVLGFPDYKYNQITSVEMIGKHHYLGDASEGNGIIYTRKGGFIDVAHLRDQSDWTAYLYHVIKSHRGIPNFEIKLGYEGGTKKLTLNIPNDLSENNMKNLAGRIAYDLSVWHEIASWYGLSSVPLLTERFSSFSLEDNYSNLLGATLGIEALKSDLPFDEAMTKLLSDKLVELERVDSLSQTHDAMEKVLNKWWTRYYSFPQNFVTLKRQYATYTTTTPLIVPGDSDPQGDVCFLDIPSLENTSLTFPDLYTFTLKMNGKLLSKKYFASLKKKEITNWDFLSIVNEVSIESERKLEKMEKSFDMN